MADSQFCNVGHVRSLFFSSLVSDLLATNRYVYLFGFVYSILSTGAFFFLKKNSIIAQLLIYLSMSVLFVFGCLITQNKPDSTATTFIVFLLIVPMFMIDKPYFMAIELGCAATVFLVWMYQTKPYDVWRHDLVNVVAFSIIGFLLHIIANSIRIKEFVLTRKINIQKDADDLTGLKNKGALTRAINEYLSDKSKNEGTLFVLDIDHFKAINDTYGHDIGDDVIGQLGGYLGKRFTNGEIVGRFGGDEFIIFIQETGDEALAVETARNIRENVKALVRLPDEGQTVSVSIGIAIYRGEENNYSEIFKKADLALYKTKADRSLGCCVFQCPAG